METRLMTLSLVRSACSTILLVAVASAAPDGLTLKDGRFLDGKPIKKAEGGVHIVYENGEVFVPETLIQDFYSTVPGELAYKPKNEEEAKKLGQGLVPFGGKWIPKGDLEKESQKRAAVLKKRIEEAKSHKEWRNKYTVETQRFKFEHNLPPEIFAELRDLFEVYYDTFTKKWKLSSNLKFKPLVCLYADERDYYRVSGAPHGAIGYFMFGKIPYELNLYYDRVDPRLTIDVLFHEGNHLLTMMVNQKFRYPPWINESMAEYFGASRWDPKKKQMSVGHLQAGRLMVVKDAIAKDEWLKLKDMIEMENFGALHYAWGWSFVHYLMSNPKYGKGFETFYLDLPSKPGIRRVSWGGAFRTVPPEDQIEHLLKCLGVKSLDVLQKEWYDYVKQLEVKDAEGYDEAGRLMRLMGKRKKSEEYLKKAIELGSKNAATFGAYGEVLVSRAKYEEGVTMLDKAIELDPLNAKYHFWKGVALRRRPGEKNEKLGLQIIKLAAEIDPEDSEIEFYLLNLDEIDEMLVGKGKDKSDG